MNCKYCESTNLKLIESGPHQKLVCGDCGKFQKFLNKKDTENFRRIHKSPNKLDQLRATVIKRELDLSSAKQDLRKEELRLIREQIALDPDEAVAIGDWNCPNSPIGLCVYDDYGDPAWDNCIFCGYPHERK